VPRAYCRAGGSDLLFKDCCLGAEELAPNGCLVHLIAIGKSWNLKRSYLNTFNSCFDDLSGEHYVSTAILQHSQQPTSRLDGHIVA
jgi:hypothetical protein